MGQDHTDNIDTVRSYQPLESPIPVGEVEGTTVDHRPSEQKPVNVGGVVGLHGPEKRAESAELPQTD